MSKNATDCDLAALVVALASDYGSRLMTPAIGFGRSGIPLRWPYGTSEAGSFRAYHRVPYSVSFGVRHLIKDGSHCDQAQLAADSQDDSQHAGRLRTKANDHGIGKLTAELQRTSMDDSGRQARGLQNRLRGAVRRPGWVRFPSIPANACRNDSQNDSQIRASPMNTRVVTRDAARVVLIDPRGRVLLQEIKADASTANIWITPGGGLAPGETHRAAALRELQEEVGHVPAQLGPCVWVREHEFQFRGCQWPTQSTHLWPGESPHPALTSSGAHLLLNGLREA